jgi:cephalosporin-C deacetylase
MPLIDKPLAELKTYPGLNPRPADFDAYWDAALRELDATDPQPELVPSQELAPRHSEAFDLWFTGVGGARVYAKYVRPKNPPAKTPPCCSFTATPATAAISPRGSRGRARASAWRPSIAAARAAARRLRQVRGTTNRGHIIRGLDDPDARKLYYRQVYLDTAQLARVVMAFPEVDAARVGAMGMSQGGALTLACAALEPRIKRAAPMFPFLCDYRRVWEMDLAKDAYEELRTWFRQFDPRHEREKEIFTKLGYIDCQHLAPRIKAEVLMFTCLMDPICPPSTQFAAYNKLTAKKDMVIYPDYGHEAYLPGESDRTFNFLRGL